MLAAGQSAPTGSLTGKLTDLRSRSVEGATILLHNAATGAVAQTTSSRNGVYRFTALEPGAYWLEARSARLGRGSVSGIVVAGGLAVRMQTALEFAPAPLELTVNAATRPAPQSVVAPAEQPAIAPAAQLASRPAPQPAEKPGALKGHDFSRAISRAESIAPSGAEGRISSGSGGTEPYSAASSAKLTAPATRESEIASTPKPAPPAAASTADFAAVLAQPAPSALAALHVPLPPAQPALHAELKSIQSSGKIVALAASSAAAVTLAHPIMRPAIPSAALTPEDEQEASVSSITGEQLEQLPLVGRDWTAFLPDAGATEIASQDGEGAPGEARTHAPLTMDGAPVSLAFGARGERHSASSGRIGPGRAETAIAEVRMVGTAGAAVDAGEPVNVDTRRGAVGLHGQVFLFDRQNLWNAQNPYTQVMKETAPATSATVPVFTPFAFTPPERRLTWGMGLGGDLRRGRLFWFAALDSNQRNDPGVATVRHPENFFAQPSNDEMQVLSARLGLSGRNPVVEGLGAYSQFLESLKGLLGETPRTSSQWTGFGRLDWKAAERHRLVVEGDGSRQDAPGGGMTRTSELYGTHSFGESRASSTWALGRWEAFLTPNLLAVTQGSMDRQIFSLLPEVPSPLEQTLQASAWGQLPQMVVDSRYGFTIGNPARFGKGSYPDEHTYDAQESLNWVHGSLLMKTGFELRHSSDLTSRLVNHTGTYHYAHLENFVSDALVFQKYGLADPLDPMNQHNCDQHGKAWRDTTGQLHGLGYLPCYSYYTQTMGPTDWHLSTNDWGGFGTLQWQPAKSLVLSAGLRWDRAQWPPPIALADNPDLPSTEKLPSLVSEWAPRTGLAWGRLESHWPVLRLGYGMYYGRTSNAVLESALTRTGSLKGDLTYFLRPTDNLLSRAGGAPPFPYVLAGQPGTFEKPAVVEFAPGFRNAEVHQAEAGIEEKLPGRMLVQAAAIASLGRRLPVTVDTNYDPAVNPKTITYGVVDGNGKGPIKARQITVPFFASWPTPAGTDGRLNPGYQQITQIVSRANSTYEAAMLGVTRSARRGLSFNLRYTYAHAMDWNPNESMSVFGGSVLDPTDFRQEYGISSLDIRHSASAMVLWSAPWRLRGMAGALADGWLVSGIGRYHSGLPYTMRTAGSIPEEFQNTGAVIAGLGPSMNGYGGDPRVYGVGRNTYRYPQTWKVDLRMGRRFNLKYSRELELLAESFNLFNHQNVTRIETVGYTIEPGSVAGSLPTLHFLTGLKSGQTEFGKPLDINGNDFYRERQFDFGFRMRF